jgi:hypothetical protein
MEQPMTLTTKQLSDNPQGALALQLRCAPSDGHTLWLHRPANLYLIEKQADMYLKLMSQPYGDGFHAKIRSLIATHREDLLAGFGQRLDLIDLGPGYPDKSFPLLWYMQQQKMTGRYMPVDISRRFLDVAVTACRPFGFTIVPHHSLFEELPEQLPKNSDAAQRLVMMGVTFMNYAPEEMVPLLRRMVRPGDSAVIAGELYNEESTVSMIAPYETAEAKHFNFLPLELLGIPESSLQYFVRLARSRIEMGFTVLHPIQIAGLQIQHDQEIVTSLSYRYGYEELLSILSTHFSRVQAFCDKEQTCIVVKASVDTELASCLLPSSAVYCACHSEA